VIGRFGKHRSDDGQLVRDLRQVWKQLRNPEAAFASLLKLPVTFTKPPNLPEKHVRPLVTDQRFAMQSFQLRLVIKRVDLAEASTRHDVDHAFGPRFVMRPRNGSLARHRVGFCNAVTNQQLGQRDGSDARSRE
jgi:hypothetical protein